MFHHGSHTHPFLGPLSGITSGSFAIPATGEDSTDLFHRVHLTVTDSGAPLGATGTVSQQSFVEILPRVTTVDDPSSAATDAEEPAAATRTGTPSQIGTRTAEIAASGRACP